MGILLPALCYNNKRSPIKRNVGGTSKTHVRLFTFVREIVVMVRRPRWSRADPMVGGQRLVMVMVVMVVMVRQ